MKATILLVESDKTLLENTKKILEIDNYLVHTAEDGLVGVRLAKALKPDIIICSEDSLLLDGYGFLKVISNDEALDKTPVIFISNLPFTDSFRKAMNLGADDYLSKPIDNSHLLQSIETRLRKGNRLPKAVSETNVENIDAIFNLNSAKNKLKKLYTEDDIQHFQAKDGLYHAGGIPHYFYLLKEGKVKSYMINENGKELITGLYGPGDFVGLIDLFGDQKYLENAKFIEDGTCVVISRKDFLQAINKDNNIAMYVYSKLNFSVNIRKERLLYMAYNSVRKRTADCLLWLCDIYNKENNYPFHINFCRDDLAALVGTAKESVIRTLSSFKDEGLINTNSSELVIYDKEKLKKVIA